MRAEILGKKDEVPKMNQFAALLQTAAQQANVPLQIVLTHNFGSFSGHSFNVAKTPIVFIDGQIEIAGDVPTLKLLVQKLTSLRDKGSQTF